MRRLKDSRSSPTFHIPSTWTYWCRSQLTLHLRTRSWCRRFSRVWSDWTSRRNASKKVSSYRSNKRKAKSLTFYQPRPALISKILSSSNCFATECRSPEISCTRTQRVRIEIFTISWLRRSAPLPVSIAKASRTHWEESLIRASPWDSCKSRLDQMSKSTQS